MLSKLISLAALYLLASAASAQVKGEDLLLLKDGRVFIDIQLEQVHQEGIYVHFQNGKILVPENLIDEAVIHNAPLPEPKTEKEREMLEKGMVPYKRRWISVEKKKKIQADLIKERKAEIADIEKHKLWRNRYKEQTKHFEFEYTTAPSVFGRYRDQLEAYFTVFAKDWKVKPPKDRKRLLVCLYADYDDFLQIGGASYGVLGYFRFVDPMELNFFHRRQDPEFTTQVLFHEANHYLQKLIDPDFSMPHFPGEAIAEYYGGANWDAEKEELTVGLLLPSRLVEVYADIDRGEPMSLERMVSADEMYEHYNWGWTLAHFLMETPKYQKKFKKFVLGLAKDKDVKRFSMGLKNLRSVRGQEVWRLFRKHMGLKTDEKVQELEAEWHQYIKEELQFDSVRGKETAGMRDLNSGRPLRGSRLLSEAIEGGSVNPLVYVELAEFYEKKDRLDEAVELLRKAVDFDPLEPKYTFRLGRALRDSGETDEGEMLMALAKEIGTSDPSLRWEFEREED